MADEQSGGRPDLGAALGSMAGAFGALSGLLEALVIVDRYELTDVFGNTYEFEPVLYARRQIEASIRMDRFVSVHASVAAEALTKAPAGNQGKLAALMRFLTVVLESKDARDRLHDLFEACHPGIVKYAQDYAQQVWTSADAAVGVPVENQLPTVRRNVRMRRLWEQDGHTSPPTDILSLFELDAIVSGLVPFFARFASRIGLMLQTLATNQETTANGDGANGSPTSSRANPSPLSES